MLLLTSQAFWGQKKAPHERGRLRLKCWRVLLAAPLHGEAEQANAEQAERCRFRHRYCRPAGFLVAQ